MADIFSSFLSELSQGLIPAFIFVFRLILPALALLITARCALSLLGEKYLPETWGWLGIGDGIRIPIQHWENIIGRGSGADINLMLPDISRNHAALIRKPKGGWRLIDLAKRGDTTVNDEPLKGEAQVGEGSVIRIGECTLSLSELTPEEALEQKAGRKQPGSRIRPGITVILLLCLWL